MFAVSFQGGWSLDTLRHTNIAMDNGPFEDVFPPEKHGDIPARYLSLPEGNSAKKR